MSSMEEPKPKKAKTAVKEEEEEEHDKVEQDEEQDDDEEEEEVKMQQNENGEAFCELSRTRRLTVRKFKSAILVDIREYYEKDDKMLPGKKGISLSVQQFQVLKKAIADGSIDQAIQEL